MLNTFFQVSLEFVLRWYAITADYLRDLFIQSQTYIQNLQLSNTTWILMGGSALFVLIAFLFIRSAFKRQRAKPRTSKPGKHPELLISKGDIIQLESSTIQTLHVKVSNLGQIPVQLLEFAVQTDLMSTPITIEAVEVLGVGETVELEATMPVNVVGEHGELRLFSVVTQPRKKVYVLKSEFTYEPWNGRHKVSPLGQTLRPIRKLATSQLARLRKKAWLKQYTPKVSLDTSAHYVATENETAPEPHYDVVEVQQEVRSQEGQQHAFQPRHAEHLQQQRNEQRRLEQRRSESQPKPEPQPKHPPLGRPGRRRMQGDLDFPTEF
ncbi:MAG: hypothetical protein ACRCYY_00610 [Trueperaceae bacterium]